MRRVGTDESGKGDYFGPLVAAAVYADKESEKRLRAIGVRDGKKIRDDRLLTMDSKIRDVLEYDVVRINPPKYNTLYCKFGNLNVLLAWAHARAIENLLSRIACPLVISDQFGDEKFLKDQLMEHGKKVKLVQRPRAESDPAVAAASIVSRAEYLRSLSALGKKYGVDFPKGATHVEETAKTYIELYGFNRLTEVAKTHFKTTDKLKSHIKKL